LKEILNRHPIISICWICSSQKTKGNVLEYEEQMLINMVSELKMNIIDEQKNTNSTARTKEQESEDSTGEEE